MSQIFVREPLRRNLIDMVRNAVLERGSAKLSVSGELGDVLIVKPRPQTKGFSSYYVIQISTGNLYDVTHYLERGTWSVMLDSCTVNGKAIIDIFMVDY